MSVDDRELALRTREGDLGAFGELVRRYQSAVFNVAYRLLGNRSDAEDATQETFLRAFRAFNRFDLERPLAPWLKRIATNVCLNWLESARGKPHVTEADIAGSAANRVTMDSWANPQPNPEQKLMTAEAAAEVRAAILRLPAHYRAVIELRHFQGQSYSEISETLGRSLSNVKSDLFRARRLLAKMMKGES